MLSNNTYYNSQVNTLPSPPHAEQKMSREQHKYCGAMMRNLKKHRDASPFLKPVDYVKLNLPEYPKIVTKPMDLLMVESKLNSFQYGTVEEFISDVRLIFDNCFKFNGPEGMLSVLCQNVESAFEKGLRQMPMLVTNSPVIIHKKREIHCPSKDYPETYTNQFTGKGELKYCVQTLRELKKPKYRQQMYPFLSPVDPIALNLPDYTTIIQHPMDLSTIETKLLNQQYQEPIQFQQDIQLMFNNCYLYNPPSLPIYRMAKEMEKVFEDYWQKRPQITHLKKKRPVAAAVAAAAAAAVKMDEPKPIKNKKKVVDQEIAQLERTIQDISKQIQSMKTKPTTIKKRKLVHPPPVLYEFTFLDKKELSHEINELESHHLNAIVDIIKSSMPDLDVNDQKEIELDIDSLDNLTLHRLYNVIHPNKKKMHGKKQKISYSEKRTDKDSSDSSDTEQDDSASDSDSD
ncbi:Bromodomain-containing protein [Pilaira anomala]|nr:Bromodomain-containing protein [Pilaira anomala]